MTDESLDLPQIKARLREFVAERAWEQFHTPKNLVMALAAEVGELLELFQWLTPDESIQVAESERDVDLVRDEIADVLVYLIQLADVLGIDLADAVENKLRKNADRYPVELSRGNATKYSRREGRGSSCG